jgi:predicted  nucleic acid-binding Zn-ribbon protein
MSGTGDWLAAVMASAAAALPCFGGRRQRAAAGDGDWVDNAVRPANVRRGGQGDRIAAAEAEVGRLALMVARRDSRIETLEKQFRQQLADYRKVLWDRNVQKGMAEVWEEKCRRKEQELVALKLDLKAYQDRVAMLLEEVSGMRGEQEELEEMLAREEERMREREGNVVEADVVVEREHEYEEVEFEEAEEGEEDITMNYLSAEE